MSFRFLLKLQHALIVLIFCVLWISQANAISVKARVEGQQLLATSGSQVSVSKNDGRQRIKISGSSARVLLRSDEIGTFSGPVVVGIKNGKKVYSVKKAIRLGVCSSPESVALVGVKKGKPRGGGNKRRVVNLGALRLVTDEQENSLGFYTPRRRLGRRQMDASVSAPVSSECVPEGNGRNLGLVSQQNTSFSVSSFLGRAVSEFDLDGDGLPNSLDIDVDNDGILNPYDADFSAPSDSFRLFSNLKVNMSDVVNYHTGEVSSTDINSLMSSTATLAIEVKALEGGSQESELDCGALTYCSAGGTGTAPPNSGAPFPGLAGEAFDLDGDGFGTITRGGTGDFQLAPGAGSADIKAGDVLVQTVSDSSTSTVTSYTGMLDFIFNTTPALRSVSVNGGGALVISYPADENISGSANNCFSAPALGDVSLELESWRPQRAGVLGAGEAAIMDIGSSNIVIDIPNAPCSGSGGCSGSGLGLCGAAFYSTSDTNLTTAPEGLQDILGDVSADPANTFTFSIDVSGCLADGSLAWNAGEKVFLDLQMRNSVGDNSAVKFCVQRAAT